MSSLILISKKRNHNEKKKNLGSQQYRKFIEKFNFAQKSNL